MTLGGESLKHRRRTTERKPAPVQWAVHLPAQLDIEAEAIHLVADRIFHVSDPKEGATSLTFMSH